MSNVINGVRNNLHEFSDKFYDTEKKQFNRDLVIFVIISMCIIYFIFSIIEGVLRLPIIILLSIIVGLYLYKMYNRGA